MPQVLRLCAIITTGKQELRAFEPNGRTAYRNALLYAPELTASICEMSSYCARHPGEEGYQALRRPFAIVRTHDHPL